MNFLPFVSIDPSKNFCLIKMFKKFKNSEWISLKILSTIHSIRLISQVF